MGWFILGAVLTGVFLSFWNDIKAWLNTTAADAVQKYIGYSARKALQRATCLVDRVVNTLRTRATVYYKRSVMDDYLDKVTLEASAPVYEFNQEILEEVRQKHTLVQEFGYK